MFHLTRPGRSARGRARFLLTLGCAAIAGASSGCVGSVDGPAPPLAPPGGAAPEMSSEPPAPPGPPDRPPPPLPGACAAAPRRIWKLTPEQYSRSVQAVLPAVQGAGDGITASLAAHQGFSNEAGALALTGPHVTQILQTAWQLAAPAVANPASLAPCLASSAPTAACLSEVVGTLGAKAFRRELAAVEIDELTKFLGQQVAGSTVGGGLQQLLLYLFSSPQFLFRTELGPADAPADAPVKLTAFERASALSYLLSDGPPDAPLFAAARSGAFDQAAGVEAQARRLLARPTGATGLRKLFREGLQTRAVLGVRKDAMLFGAFTDALAQDLATEAEAFVDRVLWDEGGKLETLLTAEYSMLNASLLRYYGLPDANVGAGKDFVKTSFPPGQRAGFATLAGLMAAKADDDDTAPVRRGLFVREILLCQNVPEPPANVNAVPPRPDGKRTQRERLAPHSADPTCAVCHALMDPIGLAFERYDAIGRHRTTDVGRTIDTSGALTRATGEAAFADAVALMKVLARSPEVAACFVSTAFRYAHGRTPDAADRCSLQRLGDRFTMNGGDLFDLAVALTTDESFTVRR